MYITNMIDLKRGNVLLYFNNNNCSYSGISALFDASFRNYLKPQYNIRLTVSAESKIIHLQCENKWFPIQG